MREHFGGENNEDEKRASQLGVDLMERLAKKENELLGKPLLDDDGRLNMRSFRVSVGGHLQKETIKEHERFVQEKEIEWSGLDDERVRAFYCEKYGVQTDGKSRGQIDHELLAHWKDQRKEKDGEIAESALTSLFERSFGERFLAVRTSTYDDYAHGVDQLIIDRTTGDALCAFDEVVDERHGTHRDEKYEKVLRIARRGGTSITYGLSFEDGVLKQNEINGLPVFALPIAKHELTLLIHDMANNPDIQSDGEKEILHSVLDSIMEQVEKLADERLNPRVSQNVQKVRSAVQYMMSMLEQRDSQPAA